ncbi:ABC transporter substrate-binding protein [Halegenticoccus soli]|uniref:ABC transporter substrate-binding protein n=1 Tax=Halegenticoccus soli TaxID=1985678 RepID=UPI00130444BB|nr:extracellular solute-binding protein [Halegenticoccus soli]
MGKRDVGASGGGGTTEESGDEQVLNILTWEGYDHDDLLGKYKDRGVDVNVKLIGSDTEAFNILQGGGTSEYDVMVIDNTWVQRHARAGTIEALDPEDFREMDNFIERYQYPFEPFSWEDEMYGVPTRWGWDSLTINTNEVDEEMATETGYELFWTGGESGEFKGKVGTVDWPTWVIPAIAIRLGYEPYQQSEDELADIKEKLIQMFENVEAVYGGGSDTRQAMQNEDIWLAPIGNYYFSTMYHEGAKWVKTLLTEQAGGIAWTEGACVVKNPHNRKLAVEFINDVTTPEGQYSVCWKPGNKGIPVNENAYDQFSEEEQVSLTFNQNGFDAAETIVEKCIPYQFSEHTDEWTDMWSEAKARAGL